MTLSRLRLSVADARDLAEGALRGIGYCNDEAHIIADHVIDAAMCAAMSIFGPSQDPQRVRERTLPVATPIHEGVA